MKASNELGVAPSQLIRYAYAGLLFALLVATFSPTFAKGLLDTLGSVITPLAMAVIGIGLYVVYKEFFGEFILYPLRHTLHTALAATLEALGAQRLYRLVGHGSVPAFLGELGVLPGQRQWCYRLLWSTELLPQQRKTLFAFLHSEIHLIYITAVELSGVALIHIIMKTGADLTYYWSGVIALLLVAFLVDLRFDIMDACWYRHNASQVLRHLRELEVPLESRRRRTSLFQRRLILGILFLVCLAWGYLR